jgi:HEAT repeat protein
MTPPLQLPGALAIAVMMGAVVVALYLVRAMGRRWRRHRRREARSLIRLLRGHLRGQVPTKTLARAANALESARFWATIEQLPLRDRRARRLLSEALDRSRHVRAERQRLRDESPWRRELAARRLGLLYSRATRRALRRALVHGPELVTLAAGVALARHRDRRALRWLLAPPRTIARRQRSALVALFGAFGRRGLPELAAALERGVSASTVELAMVDALGRGGYAPLDPIVGVARGEQRVAAARSLGAMRAVEASTSLLAALRDEAWPVRAQAARALGRVRAMIAIQALSNRLTDPSWWVRRHAAYALGEMGVEGQNTLRQVAETSPDPYARDMAREVLEGGVRLDVA